MHALLEIALRGTGRGPIGEVARLHPAAELLASQTTLTPEQQLLLAAGAAAIFHTAGRVADTADPPQPAPPDERPFAPRRAAPLIVQCFARYASLVPVLAAHLDRRRLNLPPEILPAVLDQTRADHRPHVRGIVGARGRWLAEWNPSWTWVLESPVSNAAAPGSPEQLDAWNTTWQEGSLAARVAVLHEVRKLDPATGRRWLEDVWKKEKADERATLLPALKTGLSKDDLSFLEPVVNDRSSKVRDAGVELLIHIPESALAGRYRERAAAVLTERAAKLHVHPPAAIDKVAEKDGLSPVADGKPGARAMATQQIVARVPPEFWEHAFNLQPEQLIHAVAHDDFAEAVLTGWAGAATSFNSPDWIDALIDHWLAQPTRGPGKSDIREQQLHGLLGALPPDRLGPRLMDLLRRPAMLDPGESVRLFQQLPCPWEPTLAKTWLDTMQQRLTQMLTSQQSSQWYWLHSIELAAAGLPDDMLTDALSTLRLPETIPQDAAYIARHAREALEQLEFRLALLQALSTD